jgi:hypothetical protein
MRTGKVLSPQAKRFIDMLDPSYVTTEKKTAQ